MSDDEHAKPRVVDIALHAGVGTATVDRVLNGRPGVRPATVAKVLAAARALEASGSRPRVLAAAPSDLRVRAFLGGPPGFFNQLLAQALRHHAREAGVQFQLDFVQRTAPRALAEALDAAREGGANALLVQPVEHPLVRDAVARAQAAGVAVIAALTTLPGIDPLPFIGLDNRAAGRVAGQILSLICQGRGDIALFYSHALYRSHEEREAGLRSYLRESAPDLTLVEALSTDDNPQVCHDLAADLLRRRPGLRGIVNLAAGNRGIERAVLDAGRAADLAYVAFNLTPQTRQAMIDGTVDAVIRQDPNAIARAAIAALIAAHRGESVQVAPIPAELILRENLRDPAQG